jgi:hypothetical protein
MKLLTECHSGAWSEPSVRGKGCTHLPLSTRVGRRAVVTVRESAIHDRVWALAKERIRLCRDCRARPAEQYCCSMLKLHAHLLRAGTPSLERHQMPLMDDAEALYLLRVECYEFIDDGWPPWVKVRMVDAQGRIWHFGEKTPMFFDRDEPTASTPMPVEGAGRCEILRTERDEHDREVVVVRTEAEALEDDVCEFYVRPEQIIGRWPR